MSLERKYERCSKKYKTNFSVYWKKINENVEGERLRIFGTDTKPIFVIFETNEERYELSFEHSIFGSVKNIMISSGKKGTTLPRLQKTKIISIVPKNRLHKLKEICWIIRYHLKKKY